VEKLPARSAASVGPLSTNRLPPLGVVTSVPWMEPWQLLYWDFVGSRSTAALWLSVLFPIASNMARKIRLQKRKSC